MELAVPNRSVHNRVFRVVTLIGVVLCLGGGRAVEAKDGVVLLHGLCRSDTSMVAMAKALAAEGYVVVNVDYPSRSATIEELAQAVVPAALSDPRLVGVSRVHFVTHSLGGLLVRCYLAEHSLPNLGRVVMLGPPNQGSEVVDRLARLRFFSYVNGPAGGELGTGADSLPNRLGPVGFDLGIIAGDRSLNWINSLMIEGADDGKVSVERTKVEGMKGHVVVHATHPCLMRNRQVIGLTVAFLKSGQFAAN
jgi:pimeloyl-ACP methyl ester carboxylesterase